MGCNASAREARSGVSHEFFRHLCAHRRADRRRRAALAPPAGRRARAGLGRCAGDPGSQATRRHSHPPNADGDGVAEMRGAFMEGLSQPFGMALVGDTFYVGNTDGVVAFAYTAGADRITAPGRKLVAFKPSGHWTRSLLPSPDGRKLYAGVG